MAPHARKRQAPVDDDAAPTPTQSRRRREPSPDEDVDMEHVEEQHSHGSGSTAQLAKSLVRYALACEYARIPIKRQDVSQKVLGVHSRQFKQVFEAANGQLMDIFGMEMVELPNREKTTMRQKRAAAASESQTKSSNQWVLRTMLPPSFRTPGAIPPPRIPTSETESAYVGLYTTVIAMISLSGGTLSEGKLDRVLKRMNAHQATPLGDTEEVLKRMAKEGYIVKVKDNSSGEDMVDYHVGPRGKVEVDEEAVASFVRTVYSGSEEPDLEQRIARSLGLGEGERSKGAGPAGRRREDDEGDD